jgi:hypothetical protein
MSFDENSRMECDLHGIRRPTLICHHLQHGLGLGFFEEPGTGRPWLRQAWCRKCERVLDTIGRIPLIGYPIYEWYSKPLFLCEGCLEVIRSRNLAPHSQGEH